MDLPMYFFNVLAGVGSINYGLIIVFAILLIFSAFFSASEIAFSSANIVRLRVYAEEGKKGAGRAVSLAERFDTVLSTILIGNNVVNIAMATISVRFLASFIVNQTMVDFVSTIVTTVIVLIFGEILPKSLAKNHADTFAMKFSAIVNFLTFVLRPLSFIFLALQHLVTRRSVHDEEPSVTEGELEAILDTMTDEGVIHNEEAELIQSVLDLNDKTVADIMIPRVDIVAISVYDDLEKVKKMFFDNHYSRVPVYAEDKDNIIGILYERDFFTKLIKKQKISFKSLVRQAHYVSKSMKVDALLAEMQRLKVHMAIVSGEYGETAGIVTMEDALEELVGEIYDEHDDTVVEMIKKVSDNEYLLDANMEMADLFDILEINRDPEDKYLKVANWIYSQSETIPDVGFKADYFVDFISRDEENDKYNEHTRILHFTVNEVEERRIKTIALVVEDTDKIKDSE